MGNFVTPQKILALQNFVGIFQKFLDFFSSNSEKNIIFRSSFSQKILLNDHDFWHFSINPHIPRVHGKMLKIIIISKKLAEQAAPEILIFSLFWIFENLFRGFVSQYISLVANCLNYNFFWHHPPSPRWRNPFQKRSKLKICQGSMEKC